MRVLKTMNTLGEIKAEDFMGMNMSETSSAGHRRGGKTIEKVN
jgi:hypothetical protein